MEANALLRLVDDVRQQPDFKERDTVWKDRRDVRFRRAPVKIDRVPEKHWVRTPWVDWNVHRYRSRLMMARPEIDVTPRTQSKPNLSKAEKVRQFWMRVWADFSSHRGNQMFAPVEKALDHMVADGVGVYHLRISPHALDMLIAGNLQEGFHGLPFTLEAPDPMTVYYSRDLSMVVTYGRVERRKLLSDYDNLNYDPYNRRFTLDDVVSEYYPDLPLDHSAEVAHIETPEYICDVLRQPINGKEGLILAKYPNPFGRPAFAFAPGHITGHADPLYAFEPLVVELYPFAEQKNWLDTLQQNAATLTGNPLFYLRRTGSSGMFEEDFMRLPTGERVIVDLSKGQVDIPPGFEPVALSISAGVDLIRARESLENERLQLGFPVVLSMPHEVKAQSGYDRARMEESIALFLGAPLQNHAAAWRELFLLIADGLIYMDMPVTLPRLKGGETLKPSDLVDMDVEVSLTTTTRATEIAWMEEGERLKAQGDLSWSEFLQQYRRVEDVDDSMYLIARDRVFQGVTELAVQQVLQAAQAATGVILADEMEAAGITPPRRPPSGSTAPGMGSTLVQPEPPREP